MREVILLKLGEAALKGQNKSAFEEALIKNARRRLKGCGNFRFTKAQSTIYVIPDEGANLDEAVSRLLRVFGAAGVSRSAVTDKDWEAIKTTAADYLKAPLEAASTFRVDAKRSDKSFPMLSPAICSELGSYLLMRFPHLSVDLHNPDLRVTVEVRDFGAYIHADQLPGAGGIPVGVSGRASLLVSGGIDSPVAGYMIAKRGLSMDAIHFASPPYTSDRALLKVKELVKILARYTGRVYLSVVGFTEIQEAIARHCPEAFSTLIMRRFMMEIASIHAGRHGCDALVTGESLGQVASQTVQAIACTNTAASLPVLRPLIGLDKTEIVDLARRIDTYETSILPYEDCCTVFTPRRPKTRPRLEQVIEAERALDRPALIARALERIDTLVIDEDTVL
jgi:thiamine biosynthesis protein ThiI